MKRLTLQQQKAPRPWTLNLDTFDGCATVLDDVIAGKKYAKEAENMMQKQDGRWTQRFGRAYYGSVLTGEATLRGAGKYTTAAGVNEKIAIGSTTGKAYKSIDGGAWSEITGATFDLTATTYHFKQISNYLFICNGVDRLTRYNGSVLTRYTPILPPSGLGGTRTVLTAGAFQNFYVVTALNDVGETIASNEINVTTNKVRDAWITATEWIDLAWTAVAGATTYQVYYSDLSGKEELLAEATTNAYKDNNTAVVNIYKVPSLTDTTGAPKFSMIATSTAGSSSSRIWGIAPQEYKWRVFYSGAGQFIGTFSDAYGGGWIDLDYGSDSKVSLIEHFRSGKGDGSVNVYTDSPGGKGATWSITLSPITYGETTITIPNAEKIISNSGTAAGGAAILVGDTIMSMGEQGVVRLSNKENVSNVLSTTNISQNIRPSYLGLNFNLAKQFRAYVYQNFVFYSATEGLGENDIMFIYDQDLERWYWKWNFGCRQFLEYTENTSGKTKFLIVPTSGNRLVELSPNYSTDFGNSFNTSFLSGLIPVSDDQYEFVKVLEALIVLGRPKGSITFEILGLEKKKGFASIASKTITDTLQANEFWTGSLGEITLMGEEDGPVTYTQASVKKRKRVGKSLSNIQFRVSSNSAGTEYTILGIQAIGVFDPTRPPSSWN